MLDRSRSSLPAIVPSLAATRAWSGVVCASESRVARAIHALVKRTGANAVVVSLPPADHAQLAPVADVVCSRLAALAMKSDSGSLRVRLRAVRREWSVDVDGPECPPQPRATRLLREDIGTTGHPMSTVGAENPADRLPRALVVDLPTVAEHMLGLQERPDGRLFRVPTQGLVLGRTPGVDVVLDDPQVSRRHCCVEPGPGCLVVRDLGSRNGTWVGGVCAAGPTRVEKGAVIRVGDSLLTVVTIEGSR